MFKIKVNVNINAVFDFDFNILTAFIRLGRAGPVRGRVPSIFIGFVPSILLFDFFDFFDFKHSEKFGFPPPILYIILSEHYIS